MASSLAHKGPLRLSRAINGRRRCRRCALPPKRTECSVPKDYITSVVRPRRMVAVPLHTRKSLAFIQQLIKEHGEHRSVVNVAPAYRHANMPTNIAPLALRASKNPVRLHTVSADSEIPRRWLYFLDPSPLR